MLEYGSSQMQERIESIYVKNQLDINAAYVKGQVQNQLRIDLDDQKTLRREYRREMRKAEYSEVMIREDGELEVETKSSIVSLPKRRAANFKFLDLLQLKSVDGDGPVYVMFLKVGEKEGTIYLDGEKVGKGGYLLKKISEAGGRVLMDTQKKKSDFILDFWSAARARDCEELLIPVSPGWISIGEKQYRFVKEAETLWKKIIENTK